MGWHAPSRLPRQYSEAALIAKGNFYPLALCQLLLTRSLPTYRHGELRKCPNSRRRPAGRRPFFGFIREFRGERTANHRERRERRGAPRWSPCAVQHGPQCFIPLLPVHPRLRSFSHPSTQAVLRSPQLLGFPPRSFLSFQPPLACFPLVLCVLCDETSFPEIPEDPKKRRPAEAGRLGGCCVVQVPRVDRSTRGGGGYWPTKARPVWLVMTDR